MSDVRRVFPWSFAATILLLLVWSAPARAQTSLPVVQANDNRRVAGVETSGVVAVRLVAREGAWSPDGPDYAALPIHAFAEEAGPLMVPGPLLRVQAGTTLAVSIRNATAGPLEVHGLYTRPAAADVPLTVPAGETRTARFAAGAPGTYFYWAAAPGILLNQRQGIDSQLSGAFLVDAPGASTNDRVLVLGEVAAAETPETRGGVFVINGVAWPNTEHFDAEVGRTFVWRWINPTFGGHPLHLHGAYFKVTAAGTLLEDHTYTPEEQREVVTELVESAGTARMEMTPERPGNWLFHCHISAHMSGAGRGEPLHPPEMSDGHAEMMGGMVLGITVTGEDPGAEAILPERRITMRIEDVPDVFGPNRPGIGVAFQTEGQAPVPRSTPGPPLLLTRGQPVRILIENRMQEPTAVHWHGMELESYYDGVPGFSGTAGSATPPIPPGERFEARFTPPRSGTFIYHTHMSEAQLPGGLYGAMIVSDRDQPFTPATDKIVLVGVLGSADLEGAVINGEKLHIYQGLRVGVPYRFRLINITANNGGFKAALTSEGASVEWTPVAKDGADLPLAQQIPRTALWQALSVGETYDFEWVPSAPGTYWLEIRTFVGRWAAQARVNVVP